MVSGLPAASIVTFYSWKGGVGRTMALANVAVQLTRMGSTVLVVDWDLEAPGLDRYFSSSVARVQVRPATNSTGLMGLLCEASDRADGSSYEEDWKSRLVRLGVPQAQPTASMRTPPVPNVIDFLPSGYGSEDYANRLAEFTWTKFFADSRGGEWLEALRDQWSATYDFVLIDSRTGLTDSGGVCTIQMPHFLVLVFTANDQSVQGGLRVVEAAQRERRDFGYDRGPLVVVPLLSRWEGESEVDIGEQWLKRLDTDLAPLTAPWLPLDFSPRQFLEKTRIPHVPRFSFGEPLPVLTHSLSDPGLPGLYFDTIARLIQSKLSNVGTVIDPAYTGKPDAARTVGKIFISYRRDDSKAYAGRILDRLEAEFGSESVFMDIDEIPVGIDFLDLIKQKVVESDVVLVVIGGSWSRALENPNDFIRLEVATALRRDVLVIPILLDHARMPTPKELPTELKELASYKAIIIRHETFRQDMDHLTNQIMKLTRGRAPRR